MRCPPVSHLDTGQADCAAFPPWPGSTVQGESELMRENQRLMVDLPARLENRGLGSAIHDVKKC